MGNLSRAPNPALRSKPADALELFLLEAEDDFRPFDQNRAADQVWVRRHQPDRLGPRRRVLLHVALPIKLVARIQEQLVAPCSDQRLDLRFRQAALQVDLSRGNSFSAKPTLAFAA